MLTFTFLGFEAGYDNDFFVDGIQRFTTESYSSNTVKGISDSITIPVTAGIIDFAFEINGGKGIVSNGSNPDDSSHQAGINFFVSFDGADTAKLGRSLILFLDDSGAGPDDDHDDFAVRIEATHAPEPATMLLFGSGLAGLEVFRKRFRKNS